MSNELMSADEVDRYILKIKDREIEDFFLVPIEIRNNPDVVRVERMMKMRSIITKGFDVLNQVFFIEERVNTFSANKTRALHDMIITSFKSFEDYYWFLEGDIYGNACYYGYKFTDEVINQYQIDIDQINFYAHVQETVDECVPKKKITFQDKKSIKKEYNRLIKRFIVSVEWVNQCGKRICMERRTFKYFFDFVAYLRNDLTCADLLFCNGIENLPNYLEINFEGAILTSKASEMLGINYEKLNISNVVSTVYPNILENEKNTESALVDKHADMVNLSRRLLSENKIYYISDMHLDYKAAYKKAKSKADIQYFVQEIIDGILKQFTPKETRNEDILLFGGDITSDFSLFIYFIKMLRKTINERILDITVVFILGNHELWYQKDKSVEEIVNMYKDIISEQKMYLVHDEILFFEKHGDSGFISKKELMELDETVIRNKVKKARVIILGGIAFAGCNERFNANNGIYRNTTIDRAKEKELSYEFEKIYNRVVDVFQNRSIIVFTHMNINNWTKNYKLQDKFIYVSGHSHKNIFYDDGSRRLYADNQVGYENDIINLKYFLVDATYDWFANYVDGIYEISRDDYIEFYRAKNIPCSFNREVSRLYMLKKSGYYCFICEIENKKMYILNGGAIKGLPYNDIIYYYQNMEREIQYIKSPLNKYQNLQNQIANEIKKLGGNGRIHGAIIDVDGTQGLDGWSSIAYSHLYINPIDLSITPYFAIDMSRKYVYPSIPALLMDKCPEMFVNYNRLLKEQENSIIIRPIDEADLISSPQLCTDMRIYKASRELRKMQRINSNILSSWYDGIPTLINEPIYEHGDRLNTSLIGGKIEIQSGIKAEITEHNDNNEIAMKLEDETIKVHVAKSIFDNAKDLENEPKRKCKHNVHRKSSMLGKTLMMNCGVNATVIEDLGCNDITVQFDDGLIRRHMSRRQFRKGAIAHCGDKKSD